MMKLLNKIRYWLKIVPDYRKCKHASCWDGSNAQRRMMNIMSPFFSDAKFEEYLKWMKGRGCDTAHVFFANEKDGEGAGYYVTDNPKLSKKRIKRLREEGFAIVAWLMADDSPNFSKAMFAKPEAYVKTLAKAGFFDHVSYLVLGLEMDEYGNAAQWASLQAAVKKYAPKMKIGTHHASGKYTYAGLGQIVLDQQAPNKVTAHSIKAAITKIRAMGKEAVGFEYSRHAQRDLAQAAFNAGAIGVGNW